MHVLSNHMILNNTLRARSISKISKSNLPTFFQIILNCITFHFSKEVSRDFEIEILYFHFSN